MPEISTSTRHATTRAIAMESSRRILSTDPYQNYEVDELTHQTLPKGAALMFAETSDPIHFENFKQALIGYAISPELEQMVIPVNLGNNQFSGLHLKKDENGQIHVIYFDPIGINFPFNKLESLNQEVALKYSSIPPHILEAINTGLNIPASEVTITNNRILHSQFDVEGVRHATNNNSGTFVANILSGLSNGDITIDEAGVARLQTRLEDGSFADVRNLNADQSKEFGDSLRRADLQKMREKFPEYAKDLVKKNESTSNSNQPLGPSFVGLFRTAVVAALSASAGGSLRGVDQNHRKLQITPRLTNNPTPAPTLIPTMQPAVPSAQPSSAPSQPSNQPTIQPSNQPTIQPSEGKSSTHENGIHLGDDAIIGISVAAATLALAALCCCCCCCYTGDKEANRNSYRVAGEDYNQR